MFVSLALSLQYNTRVTIVSTSGKNREKFHLLISAVWPSLYAIEIEFINLISDQSTVTEFMCYIPEKLP